MCFEVYMAEPEGIVLTPGKQWEKDRTESINNYMSCPVWRMSVGKDIPSKSCLPIRTWQSPVTKRYLEDPS